jgi:hypothetical protein
LQGVRTAPKSNCLDPQESRRKNEDSTHDIQIGFFLETMKLAEYS